MQHLDREQLLALLGEAKKRSERHWLLFLVSYWHGLRASETVGLTAANFRDGYIKVKRLKGSLPTNQRLINDPEPLLNERTAIAEYLKALPAGARLFDFNRKEFWRLMKQYGAKAGIPQHLCRPHILKHSIAMATIRDAGIENVRTWLGHKSIASTGHYLRVDDEQAGVAIMAATHRTESGSVRTLESTPKTST